MIICTMPLNVLVFQASELDANGPAEKGSDTNSEYLLSVAEKRITGIIFALKRVPD